MPRHTMYHTILHAVMTVISLITRILIKYCTFTNHLTGDKLQQQKKGEYKLSRQLTMHNIGMNVRLDTWLEYIGNKYHKLSQVWILYTSNNNTKILICSLFICGAPDTFPLLLYIKFLRNFSSTCPVDFYVQFCCCCFCFITLYHFCLVFSFSMQQALILSPQNLKCLRRCGKTILTLF